MVYELKNEFLTVGVESCGAELVSVVGKSKTEYIWQRDPAHWGSCAPVLFPIVGRLKDGQYTLNGKQYQMNGHGFCRGSEFTVLSHTAKELTFSLVDNAQTRAQYPYLFELRVHFRLQDNRVEVGYEVFNKDQQPIYFSIGAHPGFAIPWSPSEKFDDYYLAFDQKETAHVYNIADDKAILPETHLFLKDEARLPLSYDLFQTDALIFTDIKSDLLHIQSKKSNTVIDFEFPDFPLFAVWTKPNAPFICLEPWYGHGDFSDYAGDFIDRDGTQTLGEGQVFSCMYAFRIREDVKE